jgi:[ribosomal protein S18]-alanine N-acetyltransferase
MLSISRRDLVRRANPWPSDRSTRTGRRLSAGKKERDDDLSNLVVRRCERRDLDKVIEIERASFPDPYPSTAFEWLLVRAGQGFYIACDEDDNGEILGYIACGITLRGKGHIISLATRPDARRSGVGTLLMGSVIEHLRRKKVSSILLEVRQSNREAIRFYRKFSFAEVDRRSRYYSDGEDAIVMERHLPTG